VAGTPGALQQIAQEFSGQGLAAQALLRLADIEFRAGRYKEAGEAYQQFLTGFANHTLADSAQLGLAQVQEAQGNFAAARTQYQQVASLHPNGYTAIAARVGAARCTESLGQKNEARQLYEELRPIVQGSGLETEVFLRYLVLSRSVESTNAAAPAEIKIP
jgi:TolA-binding protein